MPQLNRSIQMLQEGRVHHLNDLIPIFQSINTANTGAVNVIQRFTTVHNRMEEHHRQHHHHHHHQHQHQHQQQQGQNNNVNPNQTNNNQNQPQPQPPQPQPQQQQANIQQNQGGSSQSNQQERPNTGNNSVNQNQNAQGNNPWNMLGGLMSPNSGFNFANLFAQNRGPQQQ